MILNLKNERTIIKAAFVLFGRHPKILLPLLIVWSVYAPIIIWYKFFYDGTNNYTVAFGIITSFSFILSMSCSILLELIEDLETGKPSSLLRATGHSLLFNFPRAIFLILLWTLVWFFLCVLQAICSKKKDSSSDEFNASNAAKAVAGLDGDFSLSAAFFDALRKGVRMLVFLIMPAISWEGRGPVSSFKRGLNILKSNLGEFTKGFLLTELTSTLIFLPVSVLLIFLWFTRKMGIDQHLSAEFWTVVFIYIAFAWSFSIYLEQMFCAELYLWHLKWEDAIRVAKQKGRKGPTSISQVKKPCLLDEVNDLIIFKVEPLQQVSPAE
jgi:hypothetical protein